MASLTMRRTIGGEQSALPSHVNGIERARRGADAAGKNHDLACVTKNASGGASWGDWGAPDEYAYGMSYSKHFPPTGSVHDSTWVQEVSWKGRMDREGIIALNKDISSIDGTDQTRINKMKKFLTHNGASRDSVRNQVEEFGAPILREEKEYTRKGYRRTDTGGFYAPALKGDGFKTVPLQHRPKSSTSWAAGVEGPMSAMLVSLHQQGYGSGAKSATPSTMGGPPSSRGVQSPQARHARNGTPCERRVQDNRWAPHSQMQGQHCGDLTDRLDHGVQDVDGQCGTPRSESQYSGRSRLSGMTGLSRRSGMTGSTGMTGMTCRTGMSGASGTSKSIEAPMSIMAPGVRAMHGIQAPLSRRSTKSHSSWNTYFSDR